MDDVKTLLDEEFKKTLQGIADSRTKTEETEWMVVKLNELHKIRAEMIASESELDALRKKEALQERELKDKKNSEKIHMFYDAMSLLLPLAVSSYWMAKGLKFEESGSFASRSVQWISGNMRLFKR